MASSDRRPTEARSVLDAVWRMDAARMVGALTRYTGDLALAEDVAQEALAEALVSWETSGIPKDPVGWLLTVGRRRAVDAFRRRAARDERYALLARDLDESGPGPDALFDPEAIGDDVLGLIFTACHPLLSREAAIALTLRVVGGLTTEEIARTFFIPVPTIQARITRAKKTLAAAQVPFGVPDAAERPARLSAVLGVLYLIFTEGSSASGGANWMRTELAFEALRLMRVLVGSLDGKVLPLNEVYGLLALMELTAARFPARVDTDGRPVLLEQQDRGRWDRTAVVRGRAALQRAVDVGRGLGAYGLQASIAECHAVASSVGETDWDRVVLLYEALGRLTPSPVVELNRAVAVAMASGPAAGLAAVDDLEAQDALRGSYLIPSVRAELLARLGRTAEARKCYQRAAELCGNDAEREVLREKAMG